MRVLSSLVLVICLFPWQVQAVSSVAKQSQQHFAQRPAVQQFIKEMSAQYHFESSKLIILFNHVQPREKVIKRISNPSEAMPWYQYRRIFLTPEKITQGVFFWNQHRETLETLEKRYGVPASIIVAVMGVETHYGKHTGKHRVLDALATLAFDYPKRAKFFRKELVQFLLLTRERGLDPLSIMGSYAGAIGQPQFMPSSYRAYAVPFKQPGPADLQSNENDVMASIANYLKLHGWQVDQAVAVPAKVQGTKYENLEFRKLKALYPISKLTSIGVTPEQAVAKQSAANLVRLKQANGYSYWLGLTNFYVITRYNTSNLYAMAVYQLSEAIKSQRKLAWQG